MFQYNENMLVEIKNAIFSEKSDDIPINYVMDCINYNEIGDTYYSVHTYSNGIVKSIFICTKSDDVFASVEVCVEDDDTCIYDVIDRILADQEKYERILDERFEEKARFKRAKEILYGVR